MIRIIVLTCLLAACAAHPVPEFPGCPGHVDVPAPAPKIRTERQIVDLEKRVELWGEAERRRGDACSEAVRQRDEWIERMQQ